jgi:hypothetical protein
MFKKKIASLALTAVMAASGGWGISTAKASNEAQETEVVEAQEVLAPEEADLSKVVEVQDADQADAEKVTVIDADTKDAEDAVIEVEETKEEVKSDATRAEQLSAIVMNGVTFAYNSDLSTIEKFGTPDDYSEDDDDENFIDAFKGTKMSYYIYGDNVDVQISCAEKNGKKELFEYFIRGPKAEMANGIKIGDSMEKVKSILGEPTGVTYGEEITGYEYNTKESNVYYAFQDNKLYMVWVENNEVVKRYYPDEF